MYSGANARAPERGVRAGPPIAALGALLALFGFFLPWIDFGSVIPRTSPTLAGFELPDFLRSTSVLLRITAERAFGTDSALVSLIWAVPVVALAALVLSGIVALLGRAERGVGAIHLLLGAVILAAIAYVLYILSEVTGASVGALMDFIGYGLWLTVAGMVFVLVGGLVELARR